MFTKSYNVQLFNKITDPFQKNVTLYLSSILRVSQIVYRGEMGKNAFGFGLFVAFVDSNVKKMCAEMVLIQSTQSYMEAFRENILIHF